MLNEIADQHDKINAFHFGDFLEAISSDAVTYPLMVATPTPANMSFKKYNVSLDIVLADKYIEDNIEMRNGVLSDMMLISSDIRALFRQPEYDDFDIAETINVNPFVNKGGDLTCGVIMTVQLRVDDLMDFCIVPMNGTPSPTPSCEDAELIINETETIIIPSGDVFDLTVTLDGIESGSYNSGTQTWEVESEPCAAATYTIKDSAATTLYSGSIGSGGDLQQTIPDSTVTVNGNAYANVKATDGLDVVVEYENGTPVGTINAGVVEIPNPITQSGIAYQRPPLTGQVTSYRTGDDGWHFVAGTYDYTPPPYPIHTVKLVDFVTLENNNIFGNTDRFTDNVGTQIYTENVFIDHYTKLMWSKDRGFDNFDNTIDSVNAYVDSLGNDDYRLANDEEKNSIYDVENSGFNYAPLNTFWAFSSANYHTSTTNKINTTESLKSNREDKSIAIPKSAGASALRVRNWEG